MAELDAERQRLDAAREDDAERRHRRAIINQRRGDLSARLASAEVVDPNRQGVGDTLPLQTARGEGWLQVVAVAYADLTAVLP